jgi:arginyl-tRNA synthetase
MDVFKEIREKIVAELSALSAAGALPAGLDCKHVTVEPPRDPIHGDIASNAAMVLAKQARMKPRDIAELLAGKLAEVPVIEMVEIAGPGFINIRLDQDHWRAQVKIILEQQTAYGDGTPEHKGKVNVEYVSANPTGPLHIGHVRGAVYGDALAALLKKAGYEVTKEYYINDAGSQVLTLARSTHLRYREALGEDIGGIPEGMYPGDYLIPVGKALADEDGDKWLNKPESAWLLHFKNRAVADLMDLVRADLASLNVEQDVFFSERSLHDGGRVDDALQTLEKKGLIYTGVLEPPKGKKLEDWEPRPQTLFKASEFGDDVDRPIKKSDGSWTYFAGDIAYHYDKYVRGYTHMIDVLGADHGGYVKRMKAAVTAISGGEADLDVRICQIVRLMRNGELVQMSKRSGEYVTLKELIGEVGPDVVRFVMLTRKNDAPLDFDFDKVMEQSKDNPVFYVQYAHARVHSVMRNAVRDIPGLDVSRASLGKAELGRLRDDDELLLIKQMAAWPRMVATAALNHEPHRIAFYLYELSSSFHALWNKGNDEPELRFIISDDSALTLARLAMIRALADVIASGLAVLGITPVEEMR